MSRASDKQGNLTAGDPTVAFLLTWFIPGAGHLYLGRIRTAALAFVIIEGLYLLGVFFSDGMFLEYLPSEMRSRLAPALTPEAGNLGALLYHVGHFGYGVGQPRPWPAWMDLGTTLTAASGLLNVIVMASAHLTARRPARPTAAGPDAPAAAALSLAVPGLGQFLQGRRARGVLIAVLLLGLFALGCLLAQGANLDRERHLYYWAGQFCLGLPAVVVEFIHGHPRVSAEIPYADAGVVLGCVAGMLNILVMLDAFHYSEGGAPADARGVRKTSAAEGSKVNA